ncbi:MAG: hypothetical protein RR307_06570 [Clostridia bacterium]
MIKNKKQKAPKSNFSELMKEIFINKWYLNILAIFLAALLWICLTVLE